MAELITLDNLSRFKENCDDTYVSKQSIDNTPIDNSEKIVTSGGVKSYVDNADASLQSQITALEEEIGNINNNGSAGNTESKYCHNINISYGNNTTFIFLQIINNRAEPYTNDEEVRQALYNMGKTSKQKGLQASGYICSSSSSSTAESLVLGVHADSNSLGYTYLKISSKEIGSSSAITTNGSKPVTDNVT